LCFATLLKSFSSNKGHIRTKLRYLVCLLVFGTKPSCHYRIFNKMPFMTDLCVLACTSMIPPRALEV
jgi:hypothetical protein